jgi:hypothetical protein
MLWVHRWRKDSMNFRKQLRRTLRGPGKYVQAAWRWRRLTFGEAPPIFGNGKPKSGSHLLLQVLNGLCQVAPYAYVDADPIRTIRKDGGRRSTDQILADLQRIPRGVISWGYLEPSAENVAFLCQPGRVNYFIYRDPRDMLVSQVHFATDMHEGHGLHEYYNSLPDFGERLKVAITGIDLNGLYMVSVRQRYESVFAWLDQPGVTCLRFEDFINNCDATLEHVLDAIEATGYKIPIPREQALQILVEAIQPKKSHTFRSGKTGGWRQHFTDEHKQLFKEVAGDLLVKLGYEENNDW